MERERSRWDKTVEVLMKLTPLILLDVLSSSSTSFIFTTKELYTLRIIGFIFTLVILMQESKSLVTLYKFLAKITLLLLSYVCHVPFDDNHPLASVDILKSLAQWDNPLRYYVFSVLQMLIAVPYTITLTSSRLLIANVATISSFFLPIIFSLNHNMDMNNSISISTLILLKEIVILVLKILPSFLKWCRSCVEFLSDIINLWNTIGINNIATIYSRRIKLKVLLQCLFWIRTSVLLGLQVYMLVFFEQGPYHGSVMDFLKYFLLDFTSTTTALMATSSILVEVVLPFIRLYGKSIPFPQHSTALANGFGFYFFTLSLHYDIPSLSPDQRLLMLFINLCHCTARFLLDVCDEMDGRIIRLDLSQNSPPKWRIMTGYATISVTSFFLLIFSWPQCSTNPFMYSVLVYFLCAIIKIAMSALVFDITTRWSGTERLERACFIIIMIDYFWTLVANSVMVICECYAFVLDNTKVFKAIRIAFTSIRMGVSYVEEWILYQKAITLRHIVQNLQHATEQELDDWEDICAICRDELLEARVTPCRHLFHFHCLRTWLMRGNSTCPMCYSSLEHYLNDSE